MTSKQIVASLAKSENRILAGEPVKVSDTAPPVGEVEVMLGPFFSQRGNP